MQSLTTDAVSLKGIVKHTQADRRDVNRILSSHPEKYERLNPGEGSPLYRYAHHLNIPNLAETHVV